MKIKECYIWDGDWESVKEFCPPVRDGGADWSHKPIQSWPIFLDHYPNLVRIDLGDCLVKLDAENFVVYPNKKL